jgi:hypothetical protein
VGGFWIVYGSILGGYFRWVQIRRDSEREGVLRMKGEVRRGRGDAMVGESEGDSESESRS